MTLNITQRHSCIHVCHYVTQSSQEIGHPRSQSTADKEDEYIQIEFVSSLKQAILYHF